MAHGAPDYVTRVEVAVTVETSPGVFEVIMPTPATTTDYSAALVEALKALGNAQAAVEYARDTYKSASTSSTDLTELFSRAVPTGRIGVLNGIELSTDNYAVTKFYVVVKNTIIINNETIPESFTKEFPSIHLAAGESIYVGVTSDGSTTINAWCDVSYKEVA